MGEVWLAERSDGEFEQRVAVKQLAYPTPGLLQRFRQERQILARLEHPNIARLIDGGVDADGAPYLVMEYVEGVPITDFAQAHALDLPARLRLFLRVCDAVQYAHQNLVVHRDLKPSNIFVSEDGTPKLLDFGIAKVLATTDEAAATQTVARMLTPGYAAPEQFSGGAITTATDVYALGVVLYELLAGTRPRRLAATGGAEAAHTDPLPPSAAIDRTTGAARRRALRGDLDRIALSALAAEPRRRYPSAEALAADIRRHLDGRPISALRDSALYRFRKFAQRNRYALAAAVIAFAVCLAATIVSLHQATIARAQALRAETVRQFLVGVFQQANPDDNKGRPISAHQLLEKGEQQAQRLFVDQPALEADVDALLSELYLSIDDSVRSSALHTRAVALSQDSHVPDDLRGRILVSTADLVVSGNFKASLAQAQQALALLEVEPERNAQDIAKAHGIVGRNLVILGDNDSAISLLRKTLPQDEALLGDRNEMVGYEWAYLSRALRERRHYDDAAAALGKAQAISGRIYGANSNRVAILVDEAGDLYSAKGDYARAEAAYQKVLNIYLDSLDPKHSRVLWARNDLLGAIESSGRYAEALPQRLAMLEELDASTNMASSLKSTQYFCAGVDYRELGRFDEARSMLEQALALTAQSEGPRSTKSLHMRQDLGLVLQLQGAYAQSDAVLGEALTVSLEHGSNTSYETCELRQSIGQNLRLEHRYAEAIEQLLALTRDTCMPSESDTDIWRPQVLANLSEAQLDAGDTEGANLTADTAMGYARRGFSAHHYRLGIVLFAQARARLAIGKPAEAERLLREALAVRSPPHPANDPRVLEVKVALANALTAQRKTDEARTLSAGIEPLLQALKSPYAADLRARLASP
ncbi:MAG: protein kinase [Lysobacterales bacterium]